ncbi:beta family protein [Pseudopontixanthobacter vadosimaris]|uniref:beta family protein n=1 Tax=Pseudopontixanthobacter vadosimaris TaxID=2726450 RepID=UPI00147405FB|nr:hypothetical protein [Pseudopontixanthobacter vadosimaris]
MLEGKAYVPLLHLRLAEVRALRELPESSKNLMIPIVKLRPWLNSKTLDKALDTLDEAIGNRLYGLDLDEFKYEAHPDPAKLAKVEFASLFDPTDGYRNYYDVVESGPNRIPVFRGITDREPQIEDQLQQVEELERGLFVRALANQPGAIINIADAVIQRGLENVVFVVDCGWGPNILTQAALCSGIVQTLVDLSPTIEIVVAGSSFPDAFGGLGDRFIIPVNERGLFQEVRRAVNGGELVYGDWGSTRPPTKPVPMRNVPRIDIAKTASWLSWRSEGGEDYEDIANRVLEDAEWDGTLGLWGEYMIEKTAEGSDGSIKAPAMAAAVRVNLHLHQQAHFSNPDGLHVGDEVVGDDL